MSRKMRIGTRKSALALAQTELFIEACRAADLTGEISYEIVEMHTEGDRILDRPLYDFSGKGMFVSAFEDIFTKSFKNTSSQRTVLIFFHDFLLFSFCMIVYDYTKIVKVILSWYPFIENVSIFIWQLSISYVRFLYTLYRILLSISLYTKRWPFT